MTRRRRSSEQLNSWPGFVDVLATLLLVVVFVLLVFVISQSQLSQVLSGRDSSLELLQDENASLAERLRTSERNLDALAAEYEQAQVALARQQVLSADADDQATADLRTIAQLQSLVQTLNARNVELSADVTSLERSRQQYVLTLEQFENSRRSLVDEADEQTRENQGLVKRLAALLNENQGLNDDIASLASLNETLQGQRRELSQEVADLAALRQGLEAEILAQKQAIAELELRSTQLNRRLIATQGILEEREQSLADSQSLLSQARQRNLSITGRLNQTKDQRDKLNEEVEALLALREALEQSNDERRLELGLRADQISDLQKRLAAIEITRQQQDQAIEDQSAQLDRSALNLEQVEALLAQQRAAARDLQLEIEGLEQTRDAQRLALAQVEQALATQETANQNLAVSLADISAAQEEAASQLAQRIAQLNSLKALLAERDKQVDTLSADLTILSSNAAQDQSTIAEQREQGLALLAQLTERDQVIAAFQQAVAEREAQLAALAASKLELDQQYAEQSQILASGDQERLTLMTQLSALREDLVQRELDEDGLRAALAQAESGTQEVDQELASAYTLLDAERGKVAGLLADIKILRDLRDRLQLDIARAGQANQEARAEITQFRSLLSASETEADNQRILREDATVKLDLLNQQVALLNGSMQALQQRLNLSDVDLSDKEAQIVNLNARLNLALAEQVSELEAVQSDFLKNLKDVLANEDVVKVQGDRFILQASVLFPSGSEDLQGPGTQEIVALTDKLIEIAQRIPPEVDWVLRVDGHTDSIPVRAGGLYADNLALSTARAQTVVRSMINRGFPAGRIFAAGFGDTQPVIPGTSPEALVANRRIEFKLTTK